MLGPGVMRWGKLLRALYHLDRNSMYQVYKLNTVEEHGGVEKKNT